MSADLEIRSEHWPAAPEFWPPGPAWWLLTALLVILLAALGLRLYRYYGRWRRRRAILNRLEALCTIHADHPRRLAAELSMLVRRAALVRFPRTAVAGLSGTRWLTFLDETGGAGRFSHGPGRALITAPYAPQAAIEIEALCVLIKDWIRQNL